MSQTPSQSSPPPPVDADPQPGHAQEQPSSAAPSPSKQDQIDDFKALVNAVHEVRQQLEILRRETSNAADAHAIGEALRAGGVSDLAAARPLLEALLPDAPGPADLAAAIKALRARRPGLFRAVSASSMSARGEADPPADTAARAAQDARSTGSRRSLLEYLRLRRASRP